MPAETAANPSTADPTDATRAAPGAAKPGGVPGRYIVIAVAAASVLITAGFAVVQVLGDNPAKRNAEVGGYTGGLGALERHSRRNTAAAEAEAAGDAQKAADLRAEADEELEAAAVQFQKAIDTGLARPAVTGWLAEVRRRQGKLEEADRLFTRALQRRLSVNITPGSSEERRAEALPDPADYGGRALTRAALGDPDKPPGPDADQALRLYDDQAPTRASAQFTEFEPDRAALRAIARAGDG